MLVHPLLSSLSPLHRRALSSNMNRTLAIRRRMPPLLRDSVAGGGYPPYTNANAAPRCRCIHASPRVHRPPKSQKDLFTPSPFARSDRINVSEKFSIRRELKEGDDPYGFRRYLLVPRSDDGASEADGQAPTRPVLASLNADKNIIFGAQLHLQSSTIGDDEDYFSKYLVACGPLLDAAKEDASVNGQQVRALATLRGLCSWVSECLDNDGEGSEVLMGLMHGQQQPNPLAEAKKKESDLPPGKRANQKIRDSSAKLVLKKEKSRIQMLDAVRAIATGIPRPGHSVVGAGTYRDGEKGWVALAKEYTQLVSADPDSVDASSIGRRGLEEVALYKSRDADVTKIEHLAHTEQEYLKEAGGAMARLYFL
ncbi:hypothetical protein ACHAXT_002483 [Thalassiosira profunda]